MKKLFSKVVPARFKKSKPIVPVVRLQGVIAASGNAFNPALSLAGVASQLEKAFSVKEAPAVALAINSPGGSPVQSRLIYKRIRDLANQHKKPVFAFTEDAAASGGFMIACAGDEIIADPSSIVGSIGVISAGFGFTEAIKKLGVERRVYPAGQNKSTLDPFKPENKKDIERIKNLQLEIHSVFRELVKESRGGKLADDKDLFTGEFWAGEQAKQLGLVDHIGDMRSFLRSKFGEKTELLLISPQRGLFGRRQTAGVGLGAISFEAGELSHHLVDAALGKLDERAYWARLGL